MTEEQKKEESMSDEEALMKIANAMKDNTPTQEDKQNVHVFLQSVVNAEDSVKIANLRDDKEINELGIPSYTVRGAKGMALVAEKIMDNDYFKEYFEKEAEITLATSLSREGFLVKQATVSTKQVADITKRKKVNKGWFGSKKIEESGGDTTQR